MPQTQSPAGALVELLGVTFGHKEESDVPVLLELVKETVGVLDSGVRACLQAGIVNRYAVVRVVDADGCVGPHASVGTLLVAGFKLGLAALVCGNLVSPSRSKDGKKSCGNEGELHCD